jgi:nucleoid-associated protein YgaU
LRQQTDALERELQAAKTASNRVISEKTAAEVALANANQKLAETTKALSTLRQQVADSSRQTTATSDQKVAALQSELDDARSRLKRAEDATATRDAEIAELRGTVAKINSRPALPAGELEAARRAASDAQQQLVDANRELITLRQQAAAASELEIRVRQLESEKAALAVQPAGEPRGDPDELARALSAQAEAENKLSTALRSYTLVARERDALQARVAELSARFSSTSQALTSAEADAKAASESMFASVAATAEMETLRNRALAAERSAESARAELARANRLLAALRPGHAEPTRPTEAAGEPARTHTIAPGETLSSISLRYYGTTARWSEILSANRDVLVDEHSFAAGRTLRIP